MVFWNPWHGCTKISPGCKYCYVYRQDKMYGSSKSSSEAVKNRDFGLPMRRSRNGSYKIPAGSLVLTCLTSDFLLKEADEWREEAWEMIRNRPDCTFLFFTKRIDRFSEIMPYDWGDGYENVMIACSVENQAMADYRLPIFKSLPIRHRIIAAAPLIEKIDISAYLDKDIAEVDASGESGDDARICDYEWIVDIRRQCVEKDVPFFFHSTGAKLLKDGKLYRIKRKYQLSQAEKAGINFKTNYYEQTSNP